MSAIDSEIVETVDSICVEVSSDFPLIAFLAKDISEVVLLNKSQLHPIPRTEDTFLGLILLRDKTIPVIDLLKSISTKNSNQDSSLKLRLIIIKYKNIQIAFHIKSVIGYVPIYSTQSASPASPNDKQMKKKKMSKGKDDGRKLNYFLGQYSSSTGIIDAEREIVLIDLDEFINIEYEGYSSTSSIGSSKADEVTIISDDNTQANELEDEALDFSQYTLPDDE